MLPDKDFFRKYARERSMPWQDRNVLLEYLQTQVLKALSLSEFNDRVSFLGGTCLRFAYGIDRFSEDLDFDLVKKEGFALEDMMDAVKKRLELLGFDIDARVKTTENIHIIFFRFKNVLREFGLDAQESQKILIKFEIDFSPYKDIATETKFVDSFNERFPILVNSLGTLFAQKVIAIVFRPYQKGRDFYDLVWFLSQKTLEPNYAIFREKGLPIRNRQELIDFLKEQAKKSDLAQAVKDVERFLFYPEQAKWILNLPEYLKSFE